MAIRISDYEDRQKDKTILLVEGVLRLEDAELLENVCAKLLDESVGGIVIDLAGITFLDSESASVLVGLKRRKIKLRGLDFFTRRVIQAAEKQN